MSTEYIGEFRSPNSFQLSSTHPTTRSMTHRTVLAKANPSTGWLGSKLGAYGAGFKFSGLGLRGFSLGPLKNPYRSKQEGGGRGGVGGVSRLRFPPGPQLRSSRFSRHPRLRQAPARRLAKNRNLRGVVFVGKRPQAPGGPGPKPWGPSPKPPGDLAHRPLGPGSR